MSKADIEIDNCLCGNKANIKSYFIKGIANHKNYFVKCEKCRTRTRSRKTPYKAIEEWNKYKGDLFLKEREGYKMIKADDMFEKLGYKKDLHINKFEQVWGEFFYNERLDTLISFDYIDKGVCCSTKGKNAEPIFVQIEELQAINGKCKELRVV